MSRYPSKERFNNSDEYNLYILNRKLLVDKYNDMETEELNTIALSIVKNINIENFVINSDLGWDELSKINKILLDKRIKYENKLNKINLMVMEY